MQSEEVSPELGEDVILEEVNHENTLNVLESQDLPNIEDHNLEPVPRENSVDILEELKVEELIPNVDMDSQIPQLSLSESNLLQQLDDLDPETVLARKKKMLIQKV